MTNQVTEVNGVRGYIDGEGTAWLNAEDVARGLGFTQTQIKNGKEYTFILWHRVKKYLGEIGFLTQVKETDFIPENIFYRLAMKAKNEKATEFQIKISDEILPSIRKTGMYVDMSRVDPRLLRKVADEIEERDKKIAELSGQVAELKPKADYCEQVLISDEKLTSELIAKEYGKHAQWLNELLGKLGIIYKRGRHWFLRAAYANSGYRVSDTVTLEHGKTFTNHYWTQKGREFIYQLLKNRRIVPVREREEVTIELF